jgi:hypothetical protein
MLKMRTPITKGFASFLTFDFILSKAWSVMISILLLFMDKFLSLKNPTKKSDYIGNQEVYEVIKRIVETNDTVCLYGDSGVGKTFLISRIMTGLNWVDLNYELIKSPEFMERLKYSDCHVVIDDLESDVHLMKDIFECVRSGGKLSKGSLVIVARNIGKIDFCNSVKFEYIDIPTMVTIGRRNFPKEPLRRLETLASASKGNVRNFLYSVNFADSRDIFKTPKDFICDLLCSDSNVNPLDHFGKSIQEHGYIWDIVHENYPSSSNSDITFMSESMSLADVIDTEIYKGNWELVPLFSTVSTVMPAFQINHTLERSAIKSGSAWTKYGNFKMRDMKFKAISKRSHYKLDVDALMLLRTYCQAPDKTKALEICREYKLTSSDIDVINHLALVNKLKPKEMQAIKKVLKACS